MIYRMTQEIAQGIVYRYRENELEFLVLKRVPEDGGFWQAVTGTIEKNEPALEALKRELAEEAGITQPIHISQKLEDYHWQNQETGLVGSDQVFGVEVTSQTIIKIDPKEHSEYKWLPVDKAMSVLKYEGNKKSMELVSEYARKRQLIS